MTQINTSGSQSLSDPNITTQDALDQHFAISTALRGIVGNTEYTDPATNLNNNKYTLFVDPQIGVDTYSASNQELTCGYSPQRPFATINRALAEAARISIIAGVDNDLNDFCLIHVAPGEHVVDNRHTEGGVIAWSDGQEPTRSDISDTADQMAQLNGNGHGTGGIIIPRGTSIQGADYRKTVIRPLYVPNPIGGAQVFDNGEQRAAIFQVTGNCFFFGFTFKDGVRDFAATQPIQESHHMLHTIGAVSETDLAAYYARISTAFGLSGAETVDVETQIAAPAPVSGSQDFPTDSTDGSSPYVFNCAIRSNWGMCGIWWDGDQLTGFKSLVTAQFTGVSLQRDMRTWQRYFNNVWDNIIKDNLASDPPLDNYDLYINTNVNNIRSVPDRRHFHIAAVNDAIIQEVSVFAIGQSIHHYTDNGGELTITNSNSNFGGLSLLSKRYRGSDNVLNNDDAFDQDRGWEWLNIIRPALPSTAANVEKIFIGEVESYSSGRLTLTIPLSVTDRFGEFYLDDFKDGVYSLKPGTYFWLENNFSSFNNGNDISAILADTSWDINNPTDILFSNLNDNIGIAHGFDPNIVVGARVYLRRVVDNRRQTDRYCWFVHTNSTPTRPPQRDYIIRLDPTDLAFRNQFTPENPDDTFIVTNPTLLTKSERAQVTGASPGDNTYKWIPRRGDSAGEYSQIKGYRKGQRVTYQNRYWIQSNTYKPPGLWNSEYWAECNSALDPEGSQLEDTKNEAARPFLYNNDVSATPLPNIGGTDPTLEEIFGADIDDTNSAILQPQYKSCTDVNAAYSFLLALGYTPADTDSIIAPQPKNDRYWNPSLDLPDNADGHLNANHRSNPTFDLYRPSVVRSFGHAWEWAGYRNYTKALPKYQQTTLTPRNLIDFIASNDSGGRVYNTGFTEEGLFVSPFAIQDLSTGEQVDTTTAGATDREDQTQFVFDEVVTNTLEVKEEAVFNGTLELGTTTISGSPVWSPGLLPWTRTADGVVPAFATDQIFGRAGDISAPGYAFENAPGTGFYYEPNTSEVRFASGGGDQIRITSSGNVTISGTLQADSWNLNNLPLLP